MTLEYQAGCVSVSLLVKGVFSAAAVIKGPRLLISTTASRKGEPSFLIF